MVAKISGFIIGAILVSLLAVVFVTFQSDMNFYYPNNNYNSTALNGLNQSDTFRAQSEAIKNQTSTLKTKTGILDIIGSYVESGYQAIVLSLSSLGTVITMGDSLFSRLNLGAFGSILKITLITIIIITLSYILIRVLTKVEV